MISGDLIREARLRASLSEAELAGRLGVCESVLVDWESGKVQPSLETVRDTVRACGFDLTFHMSKYDESSAITIDDHLRMTPKERFADLVSRVAFHDQLERRRHASSG